MGGGALGSGGGGKPRLERFEGELLTSSSSCFRLSSVNGEVSWCEEMAWESERAR